MFFLVFIFLLSVWGSDDCDTDYNPHENPKGTARYKKFTSEEDSKILEAVSIHGQKWRIIKKKYFTGKNNRSTKSIRGRYVECIDPTIKWEELKELLDTA